MFMIFSVQKSFVTLKSKAVLLSLGLYKNKKFKSRVETLQIYIESLQTLIEIFLKL